MFKVFKYLLLANLYKRAKKRFLFLFGLVITLLFFSLIINDLLSVATGMNIQILLLVKWVVILTIVVFIARTVLQIINIATTPFEKDDTEPLKSTVEVDTKKEYILSKERLYTKSDVILQKYMKDQ